MVLKHAPPPPAAQPVNLAHVAGLASAPKVRKARSQQQYEKRQKKRESKKPSIKTTDGGDSVMNNSANDAHLARLGEIDAKLEKLAEKEEEIAKANDVEGRIETQIDLNSRTWDATVGRINDSPDYLRGFFTRQTPEGCNYVYRSNWLPTEQFSLDHITGVQPEDVGHVRNVTAELVQITGGMVPVVANWMKALFLKGLLMFIDRKLKQRGLVRKPLRLPTTTGFFGKVASAANFVLDICSPDMLVVIYSLVMFITLGFRTMLTNWRLKQTVSDVSYEITLSDPRPEHFHDLRAVSTLHNRLLRTVMPAQYTLVVKKRIPKVSPLVILGLPLVIRAASVAPLANFITYTEQETQTIHGNLSLELLAELCSADKARTALGVGEAMKRLDEMSSFVGSFNFCRFDLTAYSQGTVTVAQAIVKSRTLQLNSDRRSVLTDF
jgi:hypothetical protein